MSKGSFGRIRNASFGGSSVYSEGGRSDYNRMVRKGAAVVGTRLQSNSSYGIAFKESQ